MPAVRAGPHLSTALNCRSTERVGKSGCRIISDLSFLWARRALDSMTVRTVWAVRYEPHETV